MAFSPAEFKSFKLEHIEPINHNVSLFRFKLPNEDDVAGLPLASCVVFRATVNGQTVIRPYTPTSKENVKGSIDFVIKNYPQGVLSSYVHSLKVGDSIDIKGPFVKWEWEKNPVENVGIVVGGTGITPALQLIDKVFAEDSKSTSKFSLVYANVTKEDILFKNELDAYAARYPDRFSVHYVLEKPEAGFEGTTGYVTRDLLDRVLPKEDGSVIFVCGPPPFMVAVSGDKNPDKSQGELAGYLKDLGYPQERVYKF